MKRFHLFHLSDAPNGLRAEACEEWVNKPSAADSRLFWVKGGPGSGNGVIGGAAALVLGLIAMALGGLALARSRRRVGAARVGD